MLEPNTTTGPIGTRLLLPVDASGDLASFAVEVRTVAAAYAERYRRYFERNNAAEEPRKTALDPWPRVVLAPGLGLFGVGGTRVQARVAADIAETNIDVIAAAEAMDRFQSHSEAEIFAMEYWSLEPAKLGSGKPAPLQGRIVLVSGGAGAIGLASARAFAAQGASLFLVDRPGEALDHATASLGRDHAGHGCDITAPGAAEAAVAACVAGRARPADKAMTSRTFATVAALLAVMLACQLVFQFRTAIAIGAYPACVQR